MGYAYVHTIFYGWSLVVGGFAPTLNVATWVRPQQQMDSKFLSEWLSSAADRASCTDIFIWFKFNSYGEGLGGQLGCDMPIPNASVYWLTFPGRDPDLPPSVKENRVETENDGDISVPPF